MPNLDNFLTSCGYVEWLALSHSLNFSLYNAIFVACLTHSFAFKVIYIQAFVIVILMGKLLRKIFFGQLRAAEMEVCHQSHNALMFITDS